MTENTGKDKLKEQINAITENSYKQGFQDAQVSIANLFDNLKGESEEATRLYKEIAKVILSLNILER
jgi:hypothetical protein